MSAIVQTDTLYVKMGVLWVFRGIRKVQFFSKRVSKHLSQKLKYGDMFKTEQNKTHNRLNIFLCSYPSSDFGILLACLSYRNCSTQM